MTAELAAGSHIPDLNFLFQKRTRPPAGEHPEAASLMSYSRLKTRVCMTRPGNGSLKQVSASRADDFGF
jgi:hypothetical protein